MKESAWNLHLQENQKTLVIYGHLKEAPTKKTPPNNPTTAPQIFYSTPYPSNNI